MGISKMLNNALRHAFGYQVVRYQKHNSWEKVENPIEHNTLEKINEFYTDENLLNGYITGSRLEFYKLATQFLKDQNVKLEGRSLADVGSGTGHMLDFLQKEFKPKRTVGLEYSPEAVKIAKKLFPSVEFYEFDIYKGWNEKFDVIVCTEVLEHLLYPVAALNNIMNMLSPNGTAFITVPNGRIDTYRGHINFWSPESWEVFMKANTGTHKIQTGSMRNEEVNYALIYS